jgi:hypothetical protein
MTTPASRIPLLVGSLGLLLCADGVPAQLPGILPAPQNVPAESAKPKLLCSDSSRAHSRTPLTRGALGANDTIPWLRVRAWRRYHDVDGGCYWGANEEEAFSSAGVSGLPTVGAVGAEALSLRSGMWRFSTQFTGSASAAADDPSSVQDNFQRFVSGGGNVSIQAERPILGSVHRFSSVTLISTGRGFLDRPKRQVTSGDTPADSTTAGSATQQSDANSINSHGGDAGLRFVYQRFQESGHRVLTLDLRGSGVGGSRDLLSSIGRSSGRPFLMGTAGVYLHLLHGDVGIRKIYGPRGFPQNRSLQLIGNIATEQPSPPPTQASPPPTTVALPPARAASLTPEGNR